MNIYPYVYHGIHRVTGQTYSGYRCKNVKLNLTASKDFGIKYFTSSELIKPIFHEFDWIIIAEFFNKEDAYDHEQLLIWEQWQISKPNSLNKRCYHLKKAFNSTGPMSEENKAKLRIPKSEETKAKLRVPRGPLSENHKEKLRAPRGPMSEENKAKLRGKRGPMSEKHRLALSRPLKSPRKSKLWDFLTPDGFVIEQQSMKYMCDYFGWIYSSAKNNFSEDKPYNGFIRI